MTGGSSGNASRCLPGSNRSRRHKRDSVSEHLTHGGSLQNLAREPGCSSDFDAGFAYLGAGSSHTYVAGRRRQKKHSGPSVSARQREGGSLPSNVNATHTLASLANFDLVYEKKVQLNNRSATTLLSARLSVTHCPSVCFSPLFLCVSFTPFYAHSILTVESKSSLPRLHQIRPESFSARRRHSSPCLWRARCVYFNLHSFSSRI